MPMKQARLPKWTIVIRDLKRGAVKVVYKDMAGEIEAYVTLSNSMIPDQHMAETNPNNPTKLDDIKAWDAERLKWVQFKISTLERYEPLAENRQNEDTYSGNEEAEGTRVDTERTGYRIPEAIQSAQETKTDDRGTEGQGEGESGEGTGRTWSSKE